MDDDDALRALAALMLRSRGWKTFLACNGLEALQTLERSPHIDAVLLDLRMPVMSGEEAFRVMRETWPDIAVVVTSGLSLEEVTAHLGNSRPDGVVQKPFSLDNLTGALLRAL
ncbi:MAG: response regulator [Chthoniobacteraceae bacterium]